MTTCNIDNSNLICYYPLDTDFYNYKTGTGVNDVISVNSNVSISNTTTQLNSGSAFFSSTNTNGIRIPTVSLNTGGVTIAFWAKLNNISSITGRMFEFIGASPISSLLSAFYSGSVLNVSITYSITASVNYTIRDKLWHHYCFTISVANGWSAYVDGVKQKFTFNNYIDYYSPSNYITSCYIGSNGGFPIKSIIDAYINQFIVFNRVISQTEIIYLSHSASSKQISFSTQPTKVFTAPYVILGDYYLFGNLNNPYKVTNQALSTRTYIINCASSNNKNLISFQGTAPSISIYYSNDYGANWSLSNLLNCSCYLSCSPVNYPNVFYATGGGGVVYRSGNGGATWVTVANLTGRDIQGICVNYNDSIVYLASYGYSIFYATLVGNTLFNYSTNTGSFTFNSVPSSTTLDKYQQLVCSSDGLVLFSKVDTNYWCYIYKFNGNPSSVQSSTKFYFYSTLTGTSIDSSLNSIAMSSNGQYLYASLNIPYTLIRSTDGGNTFSLINSGMIVDGKYTVYCDQTGKNVQATNGSYWYISNDYGNTFTSYTENFIPSAPTVYNSNNFVLSVPNTTTSYLSNFLDYGSYYLFGEFDPKSSYKPTNQVLSTQTYRVSCASSNGKNLISFQGTAPSISIYYSNDYGATWGLSNVSSGSFKVCCSPKNYPDVFYATGGTSDVFRSVNGGASWTNFSLSRDKRGMCVNDDDTILYITAYNYSVNYATRATNTNFNYNTNSGSFSFYDVSGSVMTDTYGLCTCSSDGLSLFVCVDNPLIYNWTGNPLSASLNKYNTGGPRPTIIAMSSNGLYIYALTQISRLLKSTNGGVTFDTITYPLFSITGASLISLYCDQTGQYVQVNTDLYWYISTDYGITFTSYIGETIPSAPVVYNNGFVLSVPNTIVNYVPPYPCFLEGSKILKLDTENDYEVYVPVETLKHGDLIKTSRNGYKAVYHIGKRTLPNPSDDVDSRNRLYRFSKSKIAGMKEDLCITGEHCILYEKISEEFKETVKKHMGDIYITEYQYRVPACLDKRAEPYNDNNPVTIWHFALENDNYYRNYGVWANGLLVESCSIQYLIELSDMELVHSV